MSLQAFSEDILSFISLVCVLYILKNPWSARDYDVGERIHVKGELNSAGK